MPRPSDLLNLDGSANLVAMLGPTNTGKTWQAIERLLQHRTGMMGLPLRLLAREVYDRVTARVGEQAVALVTGEEKRIPAEPRYWICTVEAMPVGRPVAFLAVDEIQLCAHRERGHVFTDRLLHARGVNETWFMGSDTMEPLIRRLVPTARILRNQRFSKLSYVPPRKLVALPPRTAVVAFSAAEVYDLAERLKARHGGTAVVLGALSPRTRNAQVAMFEAGEVQYLVATDAIGMGLNLDLDQVVFASLTKFDGTEARPLDAAEVAQIAGRAGRFKRDGRFGALASLGPFDEGLVTAVESHTFPPVAALRWRNPNLDLSTLDNLRVSLDFPSPMNVLVPVRDADDRLALEVLAGMEDIRALARGKERVALLWEVCQVPDYRKSLAHGHAQLLARLYHQLAGPQGCIDREYLATRIERVDRVDGDIETLMTRIAWIRTWTYVSFRSDWVRDSASLQARTRQIEDRLSDALHERLQRRFVDRRAVVLIHGSTPGSTLQITFSDDGNVSAMGVELGRLEGFHYEPIKGVPVTDPRVLDRAVNAILTPELELRVQRLVEAPHDAFEVDERGRILWDGAQVGLLTPGPDLTDPRVRLVRVDILGAGARSRVERRLVAWVRDLVAGVLAPLRRDDGKELGPEGRGILWLLERGLGTVSVEAAQENLRGLKDRDRRGLARLDVRLGHHHLYVASLLTPPEVRIRALLAGVHRGVLPAPTPPAHLRSIPAGEVPREVWLAMGWPVRGGRAVRVDALEVLAARARGLARKGAFLLPQDLADGIDATLAETGRVLEALDFRILVRDDGVRVDAPLQDSSPPSHRGRGGRR